jgi:hypothetical protein
MLKCYGATGSEENPKKKSGETIEKKVFMAIQQWITWACPCQPCCYQEEQCNP